MSPVTRANTRGAGSSTLRDARPPDRRTSSRKRNRLPPVTTTPARSLKKKSPTCRKQTRTATRSCSVAPAESGNSDNKSIRLCDATVDDLAELGYKTLHGTLVLDHAKAASHLAEMTGVSAVMEAVQRELVDSLIDVDTTIEAGAERIAMMLVNGARKVAAIISQRDFFIIKQRQHVKACVETVRGTIHQSLTLNGSPDAIVLTGGNQYRSLIGKAHGLHKLRTACATVLSKRHRMRALIIEVKPSSKNLLAIATAQSVAGSLAYIHGEFAGSPKSDEMTPIMMVNGRDWCFGLTDCQSKHVYFSRVWTPDYRNLEDVQALVTEIWALTQSSAKAVAVGLFSIPTLAL